MRQVGGDLTAVKERILRTYPINLVHQINRGLIKAYWRVGGRGPADLEQLAIGAQGSIRCFLYRSSRGVQTGSSPQPERQQIIFDRQLADLGAELFELAVLVLSFLNLAREKPAMPSIACRFQVLTCVGWGWRLAAISCTVLSPRQRLKRHSRLKLI